ncbi:hypothetical protein KRX51_08755 [Corynebacterium sp. TAE3-ERU12]|uniref:hypothetical protein n=1 Tax=Corynebacterium sp. TAE3-ERU12 TaxID=2849491 RepID=UPI001C4525B2|nr:hypothetical protein [Corynebacterium sp. TAE3-ERU12]MBV7295998.1 hypothetical protein [Corynebacterium sp. TAE3-ERU12]
METILFAAAVLLFVAAAALLYVDSRRRSSSGDREQSPAMDPVRELRAEPKVQPEAEPAPEPEPEPAPEPDAEQDTEPSDEAKPLIVPARIRRTPQGDMPNGFDEWLHSDDPGQPQPQPQAPEQEEYDDPEPVEAEPVDPEPVEAEPVPVPPSPEQRPLETDTDAHASQSRLRGGIGAVASRRRRRKARRKWADKRKAAYSKTDKGVASMWQRVPDGEVRDVVSGFAHGREMHVADIDEVTVIALRRSVGSAEVLEFSRDGGSDLPEVGLEDDVLVSASEPELIHRIFDDRAHEVLRSIPGFVDAMWAEGEWALAMMSAATGPEHWNATFAPLADFADIARRLPPATDSLGELDPTVWGPTRPQPAEHDENTGGYLVGVPDAPAAEPHHEDEDPVWRPDPQPTPEPVEMPTRSVATRMGEGEFRDLGEDDNDLPALGEDPEHTRATPHRGRVVRPTDAPSDLFATPASSEPEPAPESEPEPAPDAEPEPAPEPEDSDIIDVDIVESDNTDTDSR